MKASFAMVLAALAGCGSSSIKSTADATASLRPGVEDSSQVYKGTPDPDESAFWTAVRDADDSGRAAAVAQMQADVASDPTNGYSDFLIGASYFMPPKELLAALAAGQQVSPQPPGGMAAAQYLSQGLANLTDPFYLGFDGGLLANLQLQAGDPQGQQTLMTAVSNNHVATALMAVIGDELHQDNATALADMYKLVEYCNGGPVDHTGADAAAYVAKMNAGTLVHRECYSGYFAPHGSPGELLILGDLQALNGNQAAAAAYYHAIPSIPDYDTWPLKPLLARRLDGSQPADPGTTTVLTTACSTCHTNTLP